MNIPDFNSTSIVLVTKETDFYRLKQVFLDYATSIDFNLYYQSFVKELSAIDAYYSPPNGMACLLYYEYEVIGGLGLRVVSPGVAKIKRLHILSGHKRPYFVKQLLKVAIDWASQKGLQKIYMDPADALPWITKLCVNAGLNEISFLDTPDANYQKQDEVGLTHPIYYSCHIA